jgi:hypothetical protein
MKFQVGAAIALGLLLLNCPSTPAANPAPMLSPALPEPVPKATPSPAPRATPKVPPRPIPRLVCPTELEPLTQALLRDLPSYINRLSRRDRVRTGEYAIAASQPELEPLPTGSSEYPADPSLKQVFFTVLDRQYSQRQVTQFQQFHWLFLARTPSGWRLALLYSRIGSSLTAAQPRLSPPRESSQGVTGQAIRTWLRDCQAGAIGL